MLSGFGAPSRYSRGLLAQPASPLCTHPLVALPGPPSPTRSLLQQSQEILGAHKVVLRQVKGMGERHTQCLPLGGLWTPKFPLSWLPFLDKEVLVGKHPVSSSEPEYLVRFFSSSSNGDTSLTVSGHYVPRLWNGRINIHCACHTGLAGRSSQMKGAEGCLDADGFPATIRPHPSKAAASHEQQIQNSAPWRV